MTGSIGMKINGDHADAAFTGTNVWWSRFKIYGL